MEGVSLILSSFKRAHLLEHSLYSIARQEYPNIEVVVVNDGVEDETKSVCDRWSNVLDIKYIFSGQRNADGDKWRCSGFALNIGVKQCKYDTIILSCAEIYHLNDAIWHVMASMQPMKMVTPRYMYFDEKGTFVDNLIKTGKELNLPVDVNSVDGVLMPFFMGMRKRMFMAIGGYDEDFTGYACDDNDLVLRLMNYGCSYAFVDAKIVHQYHGPRCDSQCHWDNPAWVHNYNLFLERKHKIIRNENREWGKL